MDRTPERKQFLTDILTTFVESGLTAWFWTEEYKWEGVEKPYALITPKDDEDGKVIHRVDLDLIAKGLGVIRMAYMDKVSDYDGEHYVPHNRESGERMYLSASARSRILRANQINDMCEGDLDVIDAMAIVECGLFGRVVYA